MQGRRFGQGKGHGFRGFPQKTAPVKVGDEIEVDIEAIGSKGDGIAKEKGFVVFVPNTKKGDHVKVRITKVLRNVGFAEKVGEEKKEVIEDTEDF